MKIILTGVLIFILGINIHAQQKGLAKLEINLKNKASDTLDVMGRLEFVTKLVADKKGVFKGSVLINDGLYRLMDSKNMLHVFLKPGDNLKISADATNINETISFSGIGSLENNCLAQINKNNSKYDYESRLGAINEIYEIQTAEIKKNTLELLSNPKLNANFVNIQKSQMELYEKNEKKEREVILQQNLLTNSQSPSFNFENHAGGKTKLEDFTGKYVYIDVWATWCGPCKYQIPYLKKLEEKMHGKNIAFVSISVDKPKDYEAWKKMVVDKQMTGVQLIADKEFQSEFIKYYRILSIPRFILIDPSGKVLKANAARPSDPELQKVLDSLLN